jgi:hypothetical protein
LSVPLDDSDHVALETNGKFSVNEFISFDQWLLNLIRSCSFGESGFPIDLNFNGEFAKELVNSAEILSITLVELSGEFL